MKLHVVVDVATGTAQIIDGDPAAAAGLEVLCHGRRMVVSSSGGFNDVRHRNWRALIINP